MYEAFNPWDLITEPDALRDLFDRAGVRNATIVAESATHPLASPESWWALVQGSGYRGTLDQLSDAARERVRSDNLDVIRAKQIGEVETNVLYALARRP